MLKKTLILSILAFVFSTSVASAQVAVPRYPGTGYAVPRTVYYLTPAPYANYGGYGRIYVSSNNYSSANSGSYHVGNPSGQLWGYSDPSQGYTVSAPAPQLWGYSDSSRGYTVNMPLPQIWGQSDSSSAYNPNTNTHQTFTSSANFGGYGTHVPQPQVWGNASSMGYVNNIPGDQGFVSSATFVGYGGMPVQVSETVE